MALCRRGPIRRREALVRTLLQGAKIGRLRGTAHLRWRDLSGWAGAWLRERKVLLLPGVMTLARLAARSATAEQAAGSGSRYEQAR